MSTHRASIEIAAAPEEIFRYLIQPELLKEWIGGFVETRPMTEGVTGLGSKSIDVFEENGREMRMETEIVGFEPGRLLEVKISHSMMDSVSRYHLIGSSPTKVSHEQALRMKGMARLLGPFMGGATQRRMDTDLGRLKQAVERGRRA